MRFYFIIFMASGLLFGARSSFAEIITVTASPIPAVHGMYVFDLNEIWLADTFKKNASSSRVYEMSSGLPAVNTPTGSGIAGIAKHPTTGSFSFCDVMGSEIVQIDAAGNLENKVSIPNPWNARWTPTGSAMFATTFSGSVWIIQNGLAQEILAELDAPFDIAPISAESFWLSEQGEKGTGSVCRFDKVSSSGRFEKSTCNKGIKLENPEGLWLLPSGAVVAVDAEMGTLVKIAQDGMTTLLAKDLGIPILVQVLENDKWVIFTNRSSQGPAIIVGRSPELLQ